MKGGPILLCTILVAIYLSWSQVSGRACNVCQSNGAACVNSTHYHLCFGGTMPNTNQIFSCNDGMVCSEHPTICFQNNAATASCGDVYNCGICNANKVFACTSRTTFAFCFGAVRPTNVNGSCPTGRVCDASTQDICVYQLQKDSIVCNLDEPLPYESYA